MTIQLLQSRSFLIPHHIFEALKPQLLKATAPLTKNMEKRSGGILDLQLIDCTSKMAHYYQLEVTFETVDAMGANFINSCLEKLAHTLRELAAQYDAFSLSEKAIEVVMSILSNYVPNCLVEAMLNFFFEILKICFSKS